MIIPCYMGDDSLYSILYLNASGYRYADNCYSYQLCLHNTDNSSPTANFIKWRDWGRSGSKRVIEIGFYPIAEWAFVKSRGEENTIAYSWERDTHEFIIFYNHEEYALQWSNSRIDKWLQDYFTQVRKWHTKE